MRFGICGSSSIAQAAQAAGWDYIEENVQSVLKGTSSDWTAPAAPALDTPAANCMVPGSLPITGPNANAEALVKYMETVLARAPQVGIKTIVFGSAGARNVPDGFDRNKAVDQISEFLAAIGPIAGRHGVTIVIEPLNRGECNIINSVGEAMTYVKRVNHPNIRCLVDSYHMWLEDEPLKNLEEAMPWIEHVHVADKDGRVAPGESGTSDYVSFFKVIKQGGYDKLCSAECRDLDPATNGAKVLAFLKDAWARA